jgi:hypothetical protein
MRNVAKALRDEYSEDELYILPAEKNCGNFTYDGIELGGERVCAEIEDKLRNIEEQGGKITRLSIAGYSLGGLVSRYAVGLLYAKGILDDLECMVSRTQGSSSRKRLDELTVLSELYHICIPPSRSENAT